MSVLSGCVLRYKVIFALLAAIFVLMFQNEGFCTEIPAKAYSYREYLIKESRYVWGLEAPSSYFAAQIHTESLWNEKANSFAGAMGLTQFMPETVKWVGSVYKDLAKGNPYNPKWAIRAMVRYNKYHFDKIKAEDFANTLAFTFSAYNGGLGWVLRDKEKARKYGYNPYVYFGSVEKVNAGRKKSAFHENRNYVTLIFNREKVYKKHGF